MTSEHYSCAIFCFDIHFRGQPRTPPSGDNLGVLNYHHKRYETCLILGITFFQRALCVCIFIDYGSRHKGYTNIEHRDQKNLRVQNLSTIEQSLHIGKENMSKLAKKNTSVHRVDINT